MFPLFFLLLRSHSPALRFLLFLFRFLLPEIESLTRIKTSNLMSIFRKGLWNKSSSILSCTFISANRRAGGESFFNFQSHLQWKQFCMLISEEPLPAGELTTAGVKAAPASVRKAILPLHPASHGIIIRTTAKCQTRLCTAMDVEWRGKNFFPTRKLIFLCMSSNNDSAHLLLVSTKSPSLPTPHSKQQNFSHGWQKWKQKQKPDCLFWYLIEWRTKYFSDEIDIARSSPPRCCYHKSKSRGSNPCKCVFNRNAW